MSRYFARPSFLNKLSTRLGPGKTTDLYDSEFQEKLKLIDAAKEHTERLVLRLRDEAIVFGEFDQRSPNRVEMVSDASQALALKLVSTSAYCQTLKSVADATRISGQMQRKQTKTICERTIYPLDKWLKVDLKALLSHRNNLLKKRREMEKAEQKMTALQGGVPMPATDSSSNRSVTESYESMSNSSKDRSFKAISDEMKAKRKATTQLSVAESRKAHEEALKIMEVSLNKMMNDFQQHRQYIVAYLEVRKRTFDHAVECFNLCK